MPCPWLLSMNWRRNFHIKSPITFDMLALQGPFFLLWLSVAFIKFLLETFILEHSLKKHWFFPLMNWFAFPFMITNIMQLPMTLSSLSLPKGSEHSQISKSAKYGGIKLFLGDQIYFSSGLDFCMIFTVSLVLIYHFCFITALTHSLLVSAGPTSFWKGVGQTGRIKWHCLSEVMSPGSKLIDCVLYASRRLCSHQTQLSSHYQIL